VRILLIKGRSLYSGTRLFLDLAADAFQAVGHEVEMLDLLDAPDPRALITDHAANAGPVDLIFTISILGEFRDPAGRSLSGLYGAPHVLWHVDYILGQFPRLEATPTSTALLFIDPTQVEAVRATYGPDRFAHLAFMPHAAVGAPALDADVAGFAARPIPLLFSGSFQKPETAFENISRDLHRPLQDAIDLALSREWIAPHLAVEQALSAKGFNMSDPDNRGLLRLAGRVDDTVRRTRRFEFLKAVGKARLPLHICGAGWDAQLYRFKHGTYHGAIEMTQMTELMRQTRVVLNTNVNFGAGSHERPLSALLAGATPFTDESAFYASEFGKDAMAFYHWRDLDGAMTKLQALLDMPAEAHAIAAKGHAKVLAAHTWPNRIAQIIAAGDAVRA
jgi:hypothetical protein